MQLSAPLKYPLGVFPAVLAVCLWPAPLWAEEAAKSDDESKPKTVTVAGVFEGVSTAEIVADTEHITSLKISRVLPHASRVKKGQNVVWFDTEDIDKRIKDAEIELRLSKLKLEEEEFNHQQFLETQRLDREAADQARDNAQQDYDNFLRVDRDRQILTAEFDLKSSRAALENATEELEQLQQMYDEDDLTEASEEIVLKRAKQAVEFAQFRLEGTEIQSERSLTQTVPRRQTQQEDQLARAKLTHQKAIQDLKRTRQRREIEIKRSRDNFATEEKKLKELRAERKKSVLQSPLDGVLFHGKLTRGKLGDKPSTLDVQSTVTGTQTIATVVATKKLRIRVDLDEKHLATVVAGEDCKIVATAYPDQPLQGTVVSVSPVPYAGTKFDCVVSFKQTKNQPAIMPTMTCNLEFTLESDPDAENKPDAKKPTK